MRTLELITTKGKYIFTGMLIVLILVVLWKYITNPWLWFDEAGQFWLSMGLNHDSSPYSKPQGLWQVIVNNRTHNMDPGGFTVLLHFWLMISKHYVFIRLLPLLFFLGFAILFYKYLLANTKNAYFSLICTSLLFFLPVTLSRMVEIRAYSMELMGVVGALLLLSKCRKNDYSPKSLFLLSLCMAVFCTSRYEYVVFAFVIGIYTFIHIIKTKTLFWKKSAAFCLPLLISVLAIIVITLQHQNPEIGKMSYLVYLSDSPNLFYDRFFLLYLLNTAIVVISYYKKRTMTQLQVISLMVPTMFVILSFMGKYPWDKVRTISVVIVLFLNLAYEVHQLINLKKYSFLGDYLKIFLVMIIWHFLHGHINFPGGTHVENYDSFKFAIAQKAPKVIYLDYWFATTVKYMYEYGIEKDRAQMDHYPESFRFHVLEDMQSGQTITTMPKQTEADYYLLFKEQFFREDISELGLHPLFRWVYTQKDGGQQVP